MAFGPVPNQAYHHHYARMEYRHHSFCRELFVVIPKYTIMAVALVLWVCSVGLFAIVIFTLLFLYNTIKNCCSCQRALLLPPKALLTTKQLVGYKYNAAEFPIAISDCSICLECFQEGDGCRILPACNHFFHSKCVDRWIQKRPTCPVCRCPLIDPSSMRD